MTDTDPAPGSGTMADDVRRAAELLRAGELVGMPTETVYGLAADALDVDAVGKIFAAKGRPADHPLIVHLPDAGHLARWARAIPQDARALADAFWPGPLTLILARAAGVPDAVTGGQDTVGLRVPDHPVALALLGAFGSGLAAPSANRFGRISPTTAAHVREELGDRVALVLDGGPCRVGIESTILDLSRGAPVILRPGAISADDIARVIGRRPRMRLAMTGLDAGEGANRSKTGDTGETADTAEETFEPPSVADAGEHEDPSRHAPGNDSGARRGVPAEVKAPRVPGSLAAHYAPRTPLRIIPSANLAETAATLAGEGRRVAVLARKCANPSDARLIWQIATPEPAGYAHDLYANLRRLDACNADFILVERLPATPAWQAVADRLHRAASGSGDADES